MKLRLRKCDESGALPRVNPTPTVLILPNGRTEHGDAEYRIKSTPGARSPRPNSNAILP